MLALIQVNVFAALGQDAGGAHARANYRPNCRAGSASRDGADDCADARGSANFCGVTLRRALALDAPLFVDLADALAAARRKNFDDLRAHL